MPLNIISYKKAIWKGIEGHLKGIVQKLEDSREICYKHIDQWTMSFDLKLAEAIWKVPGEGELFYDMSLTSSG